MADPLTAATIATLVLTKVFEKQGEMISEAVWKLGGTLLGKLKAKFPLTGMKLEQVQQNPVLMESHAQDFGEAVLEAEIVEASKDDEIASLVKELAQMVQAEKSEATIAQVIENWKGINIKGGTNRISGNTFNF